MVPTRLKTQLYYITADFDSYLQLWGARVGFVCSPCKISSSSDATHKWSTGSTLLMAAEAGNTNQLLRELHSARNKRLQTSGEVPEVADADHRPAASDHEQQSEDLAAAAASQLSHQSTHHDAELGQETILRVGSDTIDAEEAFLASPAQFLDLKDTKIFGGVGESSSADDDVQHFPHTSKTPSTGQLAKIRDDLACPLCMALFCEPVTLHCGHSFCRACLARCSIVGTTAACPMCRTPMLLDTQDMNTNFILSSIMHALFPAEAAARASEAAEDALEASTRALPVFYLDTPFMPRQKARLLVFELRYLELVNRAMAGGRTFCIFESPQQAGAGPPAGGGWQSAIGASVRIDATEQLPGGRLQLIGTVISLLEACGSPELVPGGSGMELVTVREITDTPPEVEPQAAPQQPGAELVHVPSAQLVQEYRDVLHACATDLVAQLGPMNASAMAAAYNTVPSTALQLSYYLVAVLDLRPDVVARCRRSRSTLQRLSEAYAFLAEHAQPPQPGGEEGPAAATTPHVPALGRVHAPSVLRFCRGGDAWLRSMGQAIAKPTPGQGIVVLLAVLLLLYFNAA